MIEKIAAQPVAFTRLDKKVSDRLEQAFLTEMLKYAGPKPMDGSFSGGIGEEQFASMLTETYAEAISMRLDLGITPKGSPRK